MTKELNKITSGFSFNLIWDYDNTNSYLHPIMQILLKRIYISEGLCENYNSLYIYRKWFPENIHDIEPANYVLNNGWFKPRDIVRLLNCAQSSLSSSNKHFTQSTFDQILKRYSQDSLIEIKEEMRALYTSNEIETIINCFTGFKSLFSYENIKNRVELLFKGEKIQFDLNNILTDLYRLGFLGNYHPISKIYRWQHKGNDGVIISEEWNILIHYGLHSSLSIGKKQDFALKYQEPPQIGDYVNVKVTKIIKSFIFVDFNKAKIVYKGSIHISEIADEYIYDINDYVKIGDVFNAKIISYDKDRKQWCISKKT